MDHFTQLNLQGKPEGKPEQKSGQNTSKTNQPTNSTGGQKPSERKPGSDKNAVGKFNRMQKNMAIVASFMAISLIGLTFVETSGCSKAAKTSTESSTSTIANPSITAPLVAATPSAPPAPVVKKPVKKSTKAKIPTATFKNADYGVSFRYPKYDILKQGDDAKQEWAGLGPVPMNFVQPGGTTLSTVELPADLYPGSDLTSAFFTASVNPKMTAAECEQFSSAMPSSADDKPAAPSKVKLGKAEYNETEALSGDNRQADAKYYHLFQNGACYEFALGLQTADGEATEGTTPVDRSKVFHKLEWILSTVKVKAPQALEVAASAATTTAASTPAPTTAPAASTATAPAAAPANTPVAAPPVKVIDDRQ
jgi:hypothetical protein